MSYASYDKKDDEVHFTVHVNVKKITKSPTGTPKTERKIEDPENTKESV